MSLGPQKTSVLEEMEKYDQSVWQDAITAFLDRVEVTKKPKTLQFYEDRMGAFAPWIEEQKIPLKLFRARHLSQYLKYRATVVVPSQKEDRKISENTLRHDANAVRFMLKNARMEGFIETNPLADYELPPARRRRRNYPTSQDLFMLFDSIAMRWDPGRNPPIKNIPYKRREFCRTRNYALIAALADTGCRLSEMLELKIVHFNRDALLMTFLETKNGDDRTVTIDPILLPLIDEYLEWRPKTSTAKTLFVNEYGDPIAMDSFSKLFGKHVDWARQQDAYKDMMDFTVHHIRHYNVDAHAHNNVLAAQILAGHRSLKTTQTYVHPQLEFVRKVHDEVAPLARALSPTGEVPRPLMVNKRSQRQKQLRERKKKLV